MKSKYIFRTFGKNFATKTEKRLKTLGLIFLLFVLFGAVTGVYAQTKTITVSVVGNGTVSYSTSEIVDGSIPQNGKVEIDEGEDITFTFTPNPNHIARAMVDGVNVVNGVNYAALTSTPQVHPINNVDDDHEIDVSFWVPINIQTLTGPGLGYTFSGNVLTIVADGYYELTSNSTVVNGRRIQVGTTASTGAVLANIRLADVLITYTGAGSALAIGNGSIATLTLAANSVNIFNSPARYAGIHVPYGATLKIKSEGDYGIVPCRVSTNPVRDHYCPNQGLENPFGSLTATSASVSDSQTGGGAGIGGHGGSSGISGGASGDIFIYGGYIVANGGSATNNQGGGGAGIGGGGGGGGGTGGGFVSGSDAGGFGPISIYGGLIHAVAGYKNGNNGGGAAGIGGGGGGNNSGGGSNYRVEINPIDPETGEEHDNLRVYASGSANGGNSGTIGGAGVGGGGGDGAGGSAGVIYIPQDVVDAYGGGSAPGIGEGAGTSPVFSNVVQPPSTIFITDGESIDVTFSYMVASGTSNPRRQWYDENFGLPLEGKTTDRLQLTPRPAGQYRYYCIVTVYHNGLGRDFLLYSTMVTVNVLPNPEDRHSVGIFRNDNIPVTSIDFGTVPVNQPLPDLISLTLRNTSLGTITMSEPEFEEDENTFSITTTSGSWSNTIRESPLPRIRSTFSVQPTLYAADNVGLHETTITITGTDQSGQIFDNIPGAGLTLRPGTDQNGNVFKVTIPVTYKVVHATTAAEFDWDNSDRTYAGENINIQVTPKTGVGDVTAIRYRLSNSPTAGTVTPRDVGEYHVFIDADTGDDYYGVTNLWLGSFKIVAKSFTSDIFIYFDDPQPPYSYTGSPITPAIFVLWDKTPPSTLVYDVDYTVGYSNNTGAGTTATVTITAKGSNFTGTTSRTFEIKKVTQADFDIVKTPDQESYFYDVDLKLSTTGSIVSGGSVNFSVAEDDAEYIEVDDDGNVTFKMEGEFTVFVTKTGGANFEDLTKEIVLKVIRKPVVNTAKDPVEWTYDGDTFDLSELFNIDPFAGVRTYTILPSSTGKGSISGGLLTLEEAGEFYIRLSTERTPTHEADQLVSPIPLLTVNPAALTIDVEAIDRQYDATDKVAIRLLALNDVYPIDMNYVTATIDDPRGTVADKNIGDDKAVTLIGEFTPDGLAAGKYIITPPSGITVNITPKVLEGQVFIDFENLSPMGQIIEGTILKADISDINLDIPNPPATFTYQWYEGGNLLHTGDSYTVTSADETSAAVIYVKVTGADNYTGSVESERKTAGKTKLTGSVSIVGGTTLGSTLTVDVSLVGPAGATYTYQWMLDNVDKPGETADEYEIGKIDLGKTIGVKVIGSGEYTDVLYAYLPIPPVAPDAPETTFKAEAFNQSGFIRLTWEEPFDGGAKITGYEVAVSPDGGATKSEWRELQNLTPVGGVYTYDWGTGEMDFEMEYTFFVRAVNPVGKGAEASDKETPKAPQATLIVISVVGDEAAQITEPYGSIQLKATVTPARAIEAIGFKVEWSVSKTTVAEIESIDDELGLSITLRSLGKNEDVQVWVKTDFQEHDVTSDPLQVNIKGQILPPVFITEEVDAGTYLEPYNFVFSAHNSDDATWSIIEGDLPQGLSFTNYGVISGIPTETGSFEITVKVKNFPNVNNEATERFTLWIHPAAIYLRNIVLTPPAAGAMPAQITQTPAQANQFSAVVSWEPTDNPFMFFTYYKAIIEITEKYGYTLAGVPVNGFTVTGATSATYRPLPLGDKTVTVEFPRTDEAPVSISAIGGVAVPTVHAKPVETITPTDQYTGTIVWKDQNGKELDPATDKFDFSTIYTAIISLTAEEGYTFKGLSANFFTVQGASTSNTTTMELLENVTVTAVFPKTRGVNDINTITIAAIGGIAVPKVGNTPVATITESAQYTGTVEWTPNHATFQLDTEYTATIWLSAKPTYTFEGVHSDFFDVAGATFVSNAANSGVVTAVFPKTRGAGDTDPIVDITVDKYIIEGVPVPKVGESTAFAIPSTTQYTASAVWRPAVGATFDHSTAYTALITLTPTAGYTTEGIPENFFRVAGATATNPVNSGVISASFTPTEKRVSPIIGNIIPVAGLAVSGNMIETDEYVAAVVWEVKGGEKLNPGDIFAHNTEYNALITLTPKNGYTLWDVTPDYFEVYGAKRPTAYTAIGDGRGTITAEFPKTSDPNDVTVTLRNINGVTIPRAGEEPSRFIAPTGQFNGIVEWSPVIPDGGVFEFGTIYTATIRLTANAGFTFERVPENHFAVAGAVSVTNFAHTGIVTAVFPITKREGEQTVTDRAIQGVTPPDGDAVPVLTISGSQYTGEVRWTRTDDRTPVVDYFDHETQYTATIVLTPVLGFTMEDVPANFFTVEGAISVSNLQHSGIVTALFPPTGKLTDKTITIQKIEGIAVPVVGMPPVVEIVENDEYTGIVEWKAKDDYWGDNQTFDYLEVYTATILLTAKEGYKFGGVPQNWFIVPGASPVTNAANSGIITAVFPETRSMDDVNPIVISKITGITAPEACASPDLTIDVTDEFSGVVDWSPAVVNNKFDYGTVYTAIITINPMPTYTTELIDGVGVIENFFKVEGAKESTNPANSRVVRAVFAATNKLVSSDIGGVTPVATEKPVSAFDTDEYDAIVVWNEDDLDVNGNFKFTTEYTATITLTEKDGYTLCGITRADYFFVHGAKTTTYDNVTGTITAVFPKTRNPNDKLITLFEILGVTIPESGKKPVDAITATNEYTGKVEWIGSLDRYGNFAYATVYSAVITLEAMPGYTFEGVKQNAFTVVGASTVRNYANVGIITVIFPPTAGRSDVNIIDISSIEGIAVPASGLTPVTKITETDQFTGTVRWTPEHSVFAPGTDYTATIVLAPKQTFTTVGVDANFFTVMGANTVTNPANSGVITAVFPRTANENDVTVDIAAIPGIKPPITGATPVTTIDGNEQYSIKVTWLPSGNSFEPKTTYAANIVLTAKDGYTFEGVPADFFTVAGAISVANLENSGFVTAIFPETGSDNDDEVLVYFMGNGGLPIVQGRVIPTGTKVTPPPVNPPVRIDHAFIGWYTDPGCAAETLYDFNEIVTKDMYLYAGWIPRKEGVEVAVVFYGNGGVPAIQVRVIPVNTKATLPSIKPAKEGYEFTGWFTQPEDGDKWDFDDAVTEDLVLYAQWKVEVTFYTVTVRSEGINPMGAGDYEEGETVTIFAGTDPEGKRFKNWTSAEVTFADPTSATTTFEMPAGNVTVTAVFEEVGVLKFEDYVVVKWGNTFMLDIKKLKTKISYDDRAVCRWNHVDRGQLGTGTSYSVGSGRNDKLNGRYYFVITLSNGDIVRSTDSKEFNAGQALLAYPNPVLSGNTLTIEGISEGSPVEVFNQAGIRVMHTITTGDPAQLTLQGPAGLYVIRTTEGEVKIVVE